MELKDRIIQEAKQLLFSIGPSAMTMDTVAHTCGISKRTLYEQFSDKKTLIHECLLSHQKEGEEEFKEIFATSSNYYEALFKTHQKIFSVFRTALHAHIDEVHRLYPEFDKDYLKNESRIIDSMSFVLKTAQEQGLVLENIDTKLAAFFFTTQMRAIKKDNRLSLYGFQEAKAFSFAFFSFLRGISTVKGIKMIEAEQSKN